jgi:hypothetical protein
MQDTLHDILQTVSIDEQDYVDIFDTLQCRGCRRVSLRETTEIKDTLAYWEPFLAGVEVYDSNGNEKDTITQYFPPPISRRTPEWLHRGTAILYEGMMGFEDILREVYLATRNGLPHLAIMGIRAIIEKVMIDNVGDQGSFQKNLEAFKEQGYISLIQFDYLRATLEAGHAAIHRGFTPEREDLNAALDIMEGILATLYVQAEGAQKLSERVPPRRPKRRSPEADLG